MYDYNFFEPFAKGSKKPERTRISWPKIGIVILLAVLVWPGYNFVQLYLMNNRIDEMQQTLLASPDYPRIAAVDLKREELVQTRAVLAQMEEAASRIDGKEVIDEQLLYTITSAMPPDTSLFNMNIVGADITVQGEATSKPAIAELEYNLRGTGQFERIFVPSISEITSETEEVVGWQFTLVFSVKGAVEDETD